MTLGSPCRPSLPCVVGSPTRKEGAPGVPDRDSPLPDSDDDRKTGRPAEPGPKDGRRWSPSPHHPFETRTHGHETRVVPLLRHTPLRVDRRVVAHRHDWVYGVFEKTEGPASLRPGTRYTRRLYRLQSVQCRVQGASYYPVSSGRSVYPDLPPTPYFSLSPTTMPLSLPGPPGGGRME